jgi:hypothetical protein
VNRSFSLRHPLTRRLFQAALIGIPTLSLLFTACTEDTGGGGGGGTGGTSDTGLSSGTYCPPSYGVGTGSVVVVGKPCFPWPDPGATGAGGAGGDASGTGSGGAGSSASGTGGEGTSSSASGTGGGGTGSSASGAGGGASMDQPCPAPAMAPASWGLDTGMLFVEDPVDPQPASGTCCYQLKALCPP